MFYIGGTEVLPPPLETDEEKCCLIALVDKNVAMSKEQAKKQLIEHNLRLVVYLAKKFENTGVCVEDLISIGTIGLLPQPANIVATIVAHSSALTTFFFI